MMNNSEIRSQFEQAFNSEWVYTPICWENTKFEVPRDTTFVKFTVLPTNSKNSELGAKVKKSGLLVLRIFGAPGIGTGSFIDLADTFISLFENKRIDGFDLFTYAGVVETIGESKPTRELSLGAEYKEQASGFYQINVKIPYDAF